MPPSIHEPHATEDQLLDLLFSRATSSELEPVLAHLAACPSCETRFQAHFAENERLRATTAVRRAPEGRLVIEPTVERTVSGEPGISIGPSLRARGTRFLRGLLTPRPIMTTGAVAAAAVVAVLILWGPGGDPGPGELPWLPAASGDLRVRSGEDVGSSDDLSAGLDAYAERDLDQAIELLRRTRASGTAEMLRWVYLGSALVHRGEDVEAIEVLQNVSRRPIPDPWGSEARWSLYVALQRTGQEASADSLLRLLAEQPGEIGRRARKISSD